MCWLSSYRPGASGRTPKLYWSQSLPCAPENGARRHFPSFLLWRQRLRVPPGADTASQGWRSGRKRPSDSEKTPLSGTARGYSSFRITGKRTMDARRNAPHFRARHFPVLAVFLHRILSPSHTAVSTACAYTISYRNCRVILQVTKKKPHASAHGFFFVLASSYRPGPLPAKYCQHQ